MSTRPTSESGRDEIVAWLEQQPGHQAGDALTRINLGYPAGEVLADFLAGRHTVAGQTSIDGWPYGTTHDMDCPGCEGVPFTLSPRSETYWSS